MGRDPINPSKNKHKRTTVASTFVCAYVTTNNVTKCITIESANDGTNAHTNAITYGYAIESANVFH
jgi:hypothetical protein